MPSFYRRWLRLILLFVIGVCLCLSYAAVGEKALGQEKGRSVSAETLVDQGLRNYQGGKFSEAIAQWEQALSQVGNSQERAIVQTNLGQAYWQVGQTDKAIAQWEQAIQFYQGKNDRESQVTLAQLLTEQAQAYSDLGLHTTAIDRLTTAIELAKKQQDESIEAAAQGALGNAYWSMGAYETALLAHQQSLNLACKLDDSSYITTALNNLGNVFASRSERFRYQATAAKLEGDTPNENLLTRQANHDGRVALASYLRSAEVSRSVSKLAEAKALLNLNRLLDQLPVASAVAMPELACSTLNFKALLSPSEKVLPSPKADSPSQIIARNRTQILALLEAEPDSQDKAYGYINLVCSYTREVCKHSQQTGEATEDKSPPVAIAEVEPLLQKALTAARNVGDTRAESYALGTLGEVYEAHQKYDEAMSLSRQAQFTAQRVNAGDSLYRWQWLSGRIFKATGQKEQAIASYEQAIATLQSIRNDIVVANKDLQFDFRDSVEPVYRQLIELLLEDDRNEERQKAEGRGQTVGAGFTSMSTQLASSSLNPPSKFSQEQATDTANSQLETAAENLKLKSQRGKDNQLSIKLAAKSNNSANIKKVLDIIELLKLAELQNFFGDDCVQLAKDAATREQSLPAGGDNQEPTYGLVDPNSAVVYSVVLDDSTYMILRSPAGKLKKYLVLANPANDTSGAKSLNGQKLPLRRKQLEEQIDQLRLMLEKRATEEYLIGAQAIYDELIRPMEADLKAANPKTLVFVNDGVLRKIPMGALHDGKQFLIEKYPIATTPSLSLTTRRPFNRRNLQALILGLTVEQEPFNALPNVATEAQEVQKILGGTKLLDQEFTLKSMQQRLQQNSYRIVHMATHGKFGADASSTFLLAYRDRITINQLDEVLRTRRTRDPVELLTLSACQTAAGDDRSALGIAGVAVRAGVKSAVATLWFINDESTVPLIQEFYTQLLKPNVTKAEALRAAQLKLIASREYNHPAVWSPFILIGNWL